MNKIKITSAVMRSLSFLSFIITLVCLPIFLLYALSSSEEYKMLFLIIPAQLSLGAKLIAVLPFSVALLGATFIAYFSYKFFSYLAQGELFTARVVDTLKKAGYFYLAGIILYSILCLSINYFCPELSAQIHLQFKPEIADVVNFIAPLLVILGAWVLDEARKLKAMA